MKHFTFSLKMLLLSLCVVGGVNSAWGTTTYKLVQVTSVEAGELYVFEQDGYVMNNTVTSKALQTTNSYKKTGLAGTESYVWTLETATDGFYMKNVSLSSNQYLNNTSGKADVSFGNKSTIWDFDFQTDNTVLIQNPSNSNRFLGDNGSNAYKAYAASNLSSYPHAIKVYKLVEEDSSKVPAPSFNPTGGTFNTTKTVEISAVEDATIYYTTDGSEPTTSSDVYSTSIAVNQTMTIKAFAVKSGLTNSDVASATYTLKAVAPTISEETEGEIYKKVTLSSTTDGSAIYYTTNGDEPTTSSNLYSNAFYVRNSCTVKAVTVKAGWTNSDVASKEYTITLGAPNITNSGKEVTITATEGATIYYTLDGTTPSNTSTEYTDKFDLTVSPTTVKAIAYDAYGNVSEVASKAITFVDGNVIWSEDFSTFKANDVPVEGVNATYVMKDGGSDTKIYDATLAGGTTPELLIGKSQGSMTATINLRRYYGNMTLAFKSNHSDYLTITSTTTGVTVGEANNESGQTIVPITGVPKGTYNLVLVIKNTNSSNARVDNFELYATSRSDLAVTVSAAGYATYVADVAVDYAASTGVTAYVVSAVGTDDVTLTEVESVPANTPVVVKAAAAGTYPLTLAESATAPETNYLKVSDGTVTGDGSTIYALANKGGVGFFLVDDGLAIPAGKCYLDGTASAAKARLGFSFEGEDATAITAIEATEAVNNGVIYNLNGQRVVKPLKGIYIQNGKKFIVK